MSPALIVRALDLAARRVSFYEAAEGDYSREAIPRARAKRRFWSLFHRAARRNIVFDTTGYLL